MDTFVDSSWYFARFTDPHAEDAGRHGRGRLLAARSISISAASSTRSCTCSIRASSRAPCATPATGSKNLREPFAALFTQGMVTHETYKSTTRRLAAADARCASRAKATARRAFEVATGEPVAIGSIEKMSKSKKNTVDPDDFIDALRRRRRPLVHALRQPARARRHLDGRRRRRRRVASCSASGGSSSHGATKRPPKGAAKPAAFGPEATALRRAAHKASRCQSPARSRASLQRGRRPRLRVHKCFGSALGKSAGTASPGPCARPLEFLVQMIGPMMPHLAEECWARLGYNTLLANQPWPEADPALLVDDTITIAVQVNGKRRDELTIARTAGWRNRGCGSELEAGASGLSKAGRSRRSSSCRRGL